MPPKKSNKIIECPKCSRQVLEGQLSKHQMSSTCGDELWQKYYRMSGRHKCPCEKCKNKKTLSSSTIWRHLKEGQKYWDEMKIRMQKRDDKIREKKYKSLYPDSDSDSERDL